MVLHYIFQFYTPMHAVMLTSYKKPHLLRLRENNFALLVEGAYTGVSITLVISDH